jgi:hypothetical protein
MFPRCLLACGLFLACGIACGDTFLATIVKVDGTKVTLKKATYNPAGVADKYKYDDPITIEATKDAAVTVGHFLPTDTKIPEQTTPLKDGMKNPAFGKLGDRPTRPGLVTVADKGDDKGKLTAINFWKSAAPK